MTDPLFTSTPLGPLLLRNRFVRAAAFEGMCQGGLVQKALLDYHVELAAGGVAMTTVAYASVARDGRSYGHQLDMQHPDVATGLAQLCDAVHREGAKVAIQLGHCGYFADRRLLGERPLGVSSVFNTYGLCWPRVMTEGDMERVIDDFAQAAALSAEAGFDCIELHFGHGYLVSQFLSPHTNRRKDRWGGSLENRARFGLEVLRAVRRVLPEGVAVIAKINLSDGFKGGLQLEDAVVFSQLLEREGIHGLVLSGGFVSKTPMYVMRGDVPFAEFYQGQTQLGKKLGLLMMGRLLIKRFPFEEAYFLRQAQAVRRAVSLPLMLVGGLRTRKMMEHVVDQGFELLALARPLIIEPNFVRKLERRETDESLCEPCNKCIAAMDHDGIHCPKRHAL